jgi:hypothetical protein
MNSANCFSAWILLLAALLRTCAAGKPSVLSYTAEGAVSSRRFVLLPETVDGFNAASAQCRNYSSNATLATLSIPADSALIGWLGRRLARAAWIGGFVGAGSGNWTRCVAVYGGGAVAIPGGIGCLRRLPVLCELQSSGERD